MSYYLWHRVVQHIQNGDHGKDRGYAQRNARRGGTSRQQEAYPGDDDDESAGAINVN